MRMIARPFTYSHEEGASLIELMIALFLFAIVGWGFSHFLFRTNKLGNEEAARASTSSDLNRILRLVEQDFMYMDMNVSTELCASGTCTNFTIKRLAYGSGTYSVTYRSVCRSYSGTAPAGVIQSFQGLTGTKCLGLLNSGSGCQAGTYPAVQITAVLDNPPTGSLGQYPAVMPENVEARSATQWMIGTALCMVSNPLENRGTRNIAKNQLIAEGAFLDSAGRVRVVSYHRNLTSANQSDLQLVPKLP